MSNRGKYLTNPRPGPIKPLSFIALLFLLYSPAFANSAPESSDQPDRKRKFAVGIEYIGGEIVYGFKEAWSAELRFLTDKTSTDFGDLNTYVAGLRLDRHFKTGRRLQYYAGLEGAYIFSGIKSAGGYSSSREYSANGEAFGAYGGVELYILRRLSITFDMGPYYMLLKERTSQADNNGLEFVISSSVRFFIF